MVRCCEVCAGASTTATAGQRRGKLRRVLVESRLVTLCETHARIVAEAPARTLAEIRELFPEQDGRRSLVARRTPLDRRVFPPRPEGRRKSAGRRATDDLDG